jgi:glycosyltransferase involved in cell wall biosynthesis
VCLISAEYAPRVGGLADYTRLLAEHLQHQGAEVSVLTTAGAAPSEAAERFPVVRGPERWNFGVYRSLRAAIGRFAPDVLHLQFQAAAYAMHPAVMLAPAWLHRQRTGIRWVTTFHDLREPYLFPKAGPVRRWLVRRLALDSTAVVATNGPDAAALRAMGANVHLIPIGANLPLPSGRRLSREDVAQRWGVPPDARLLGFFGLMNHSKGFDTLLRTLRLLADGDVDAWLLGVGERFGASDPTNRAYAARMDALAAELGVADRVRWTGFLPPDEAALALGSVEVCVLPFTAGASYRHGTLLTALAAGLPVVTTVPPDGPDGDGPPTPTPGEHALLFAPGDAAAAAVAVTQLLHDPALRARLAGGGRRLAQHFSWERIAEQHLRLYETLV